MKNAKRKAGLSTGDVDYINAHGTSTPLNDRIEAKAIADVFGDRTEEILVNSTKSMVGHLLGAAGAVEAAAVALQMVNKTIHPSLNFENPDPESRLNIAAKAVKKEIRCALSNSFGFGGHNCCIAFGRMDA